MLAEHRVLTPESVEFHYEIAGPASRMAAAVLDHLVMIAGLFALWIALLLSSVVACALTSGLIRFFQGGMAIAAAIFGSFLLYFGYFAFFEWRWNGQTPGKRWLGLRVIDDRGMNLDLYQALLRNLFRTIDMLPLLVGLDFLAIGCYGLGGAISLGSATGKRAGDWVAGTLVVRTRRRVLPEAILAPTEKYNTLLEDATLRARVRARLSLEARETLLQLCLRRHELELEARQRLFAEAAAWLEELLATRREPYLSEEKFVQNIVAIAMAGEGSGRWLSSSLPA